MKLASLPTPEKTKDALAAVVALRTMADRLERKAVQKALAKGWTWAQIAENLGVTRQAVHKKYAKSLKAKP